LRKLLVVISCLFIITSNQAQYEQISGQINSYYEVTGVSGSRVQLKAGSDLSGISAGDKMILMQMTGVDITVLSVTQNVNGVNSFVNAGKYELLAVAAVDDAADSINFTVTLDPGRYTSGEKIQLIKIYEADYAQVDGTVTAADWNGSTGGVIAMVIFKKLVLNANIDASNRGFRGGTPEPDYSRGCLEPDTFYFTEAQTGSAGHRGESNVRADFQYTKGPGRVVIAGGGGAGYFTGGGGGGNYGSGGSSGVQHVGCTQSWSRGGYSLGSNNFYGYDRVSMGGGGGSSTEDGTSAATDGGDGGGIVIILADTIQGNGNSIISNGQTVTGVAMAGGGGGGAGGSVLMDVNIYQNR
jgi:hypothetical protein